MTTQHTVTGALTADQVKWFSKVDELVIAHIPDATADPYSSGYGTIEVRVRCTSTDCHAPAPCYTVRETIGVHSQVETFDPDEYQRNIRQSAYSCEAHLYGGNSYYNEVNTAVRHLKAGDVLSLYWLRGNDFSWMRKAGIHRDELRLRVQRDGGTKREHGLEYTLSVRERQDADTYAYTKMTRLVGVEVLAEASV